MKREYFVEACLDLFKMVIAGACGNPLLKCNIPTIEHEKTAGWYLIHHLNLLHKEYTEYDDFIAYIALGHEKLCHYIYNKVNPLKINPTDMANLIAASQFSTPEDPALAITFETQLFETFEEELEDESSTHYPGSNSSICTPPEGDEDQETDNNTLVSNLSLPEVNPNKNRSLLMLATLSVENEIEIAQAKAATLAAMNSSSEVERLKKESAAIALKKAAEDAAGGDTIGEALESHLDKKFVSRKTLMTLLKSMSNNNQPKTTKVKNTYKPSKGQGQQNARQQQHHQNTNRQLQWSPPGRTPSNHSNSNSNSSHKKRGRDNNSKGAGPSQGGNNRNRDNRYNDNRNNQGRHHQNDRNGRGNRS